jgi:raffinose/stachyose/melibiose transport system permease protein
MTDRSDHTRATWRQSLQGWLWVAPALLFLVVFVYGPALTNIRFSLFSFSAMSLDWDFRRLRQLSAAVERSEVHHSTDQ